VSYGLTVDRGGAYNRLVDRDWQDPLDTSHSKTRGGRWNAAGTFGALYLNATERVARIQVAHKLAGRPYTIEDLDPAEQHDLASVEVPPAARLDCVTDDGLSAVELPPSYPVDARGNAIGHDICQPIGQRAYDAERSGIACRSAASGARPDDEELALFDTHAGTAQVTGRRPFADWFLGG
jgi:RES domain-containing protein